MDKSGITPSGLSALDKHSVHQLPSLTEEQLSKLPTGFVSYAIESLCDTGSASEAYKLFCSALSAKIEVRRPACLIDDLINRKEIDRAASVLERWYQGVVEKTQADRVGYAKSLHAIGDTEKAFVELKKTMELFPRSSKAALQAARFALLADERSESLAYFEQALEINQNQPAWVWRAIQALRHERVSLFGVDLHVPQTVVNGQVLIGLVQGGYEQHERSALLADLQPEDRVLELGAGLGFLACCVARAHPSLPYLAVEANPDLCKVVRENFTLNGSDARLISGVASLFDGKSTFHISERFIASSSKIKVGEVDSVDLVSIDVNRLISEFKPTVMVIDIEGSEVDIVGYINFNNVRRIVLEIHPKIYSNFEAKELFENIIGGGFYMDISYCSNNVFVFEK